MTDSNSPDQGPKPFKPDPKRRLFDPPSGEPRRFFAEPDPNYDPDKLDQAPTTGQETPFRSAAIKCAQMEEEICGIVSGLKLDNGSYYDYFDKKSGEDLLVLENSHIEAEDAFSIHLSGTGLQHRTKYGKIYFHNKSFPKIEEDSGTDKVLAIDGVISDPETNANFTAKLQDSDIPTGYSMFLFTKTGEYQKFIILSPDTLPGLNLKAVGREDTVTGKGIRYEAEMTPGDFELAQQTLQELIDTLQKAQRKKAAKK